ncbi:hypothetical protein N825_08345 [Skermanella stibiiresistens SB22]|uniref:Membrane bound FAD containing D-sorbitol dehydrogenase n=1 Tax=Skermanella stibiiresistens SB22 TaxID=1385369 RepID=W9H2H0_9PROT|nr:sugar dehydrogenase complex small subunit [Skermanella stibiiresistens]EWY39001.1 hypothetical protein N825_08345 [Skermanella stibiiresistens SB22]
MSDAQASPAKEPTRRDVLTGLAGGVALALAPASALGAMAGAPGKAITPFLAISSKLTGIELDASYLDLARTVWDALVPVHGLPTLETLVQVVANAPPDRPLKDVMVEHGLLPVAQALTSTWYTGASATVGGPVLFYDDALMWRACAFTKPPVTCGGEFGYWQHAWVPPTTGLAVNVPSSKNRA